VGGVVVNAMAGDSNGPLRFAPRLVLVAVLAVVITLAIVLELARLDVVGNGADAGAT